MYGLFRFTYDYHQFQRLVCVSASVEALERHYEQMKEKSPAIFLLVPEEKHDEFWDNEDAHYCILPVEEVK